MDSIARHYRASSYQGEMGTDAFNQALQDWLNEQTGGLLKEQAEGIKLPPETILALATTVYFRSKWSSEFSESQTTDGTFLAPGGETDCRFMHQSGSRDYYWGSRFSAVAQYLENNGAMWFLLPDEGISPEELLQDREAMDFLLANGRWDNSKFLTVNLSLPKFDVSSDLDLIEDLKTLGITDVFDPECLGEWNVPCPHCGELQPLTWEGVVFDKDNLDTIQYCCSKCAALATEAEWKKGFINGKYIHADPENPVRGFHLNALGSSLARWRDIVEKFLLANEEKKKGNIEELKSWTNTKMGQTWEEEGTEVDESALMKRRERYNCEVPPEVLYLTAGVDTQDDRFEVEVVGWGVDYESWGIKYAAIYGDLKLDQVWKDLDAFLSQTFTKPDGTKLKIICVCMDTGGHFTNQVYRFCKARYARGLRAIKGSNDSQSAYIQKPTKGNREGVNLFMLGVDTGKSLLLQRLLLEDEGPGYCHFPKEEGRGYDESFFIGLTAEKQVLTYKKGRPVFEWKIKD